jgi:EAL domain-containing protein (putative c-di-GMP-specific phosphodiesterase class I)
MYYAKKNKESFVTFDEEVYKQKIEKDELNDAFNKMLLSGDFTYYGRKLFTLDGTSTKYMQVYTKDKDGNSFLNSKLYSSIRNNTTIKKFDLHNLQMLVEKSSMSYTHSKYFINIDYNSLLSIKELIPFFITLKESTFNGLNNVILSVDLTGMESTEYDITLDILILLARLGFKIKLDKVSNKIADYFIFSANPHFIKLSVDEWKNIRCDKTYKILESRLSTYKLYGANTKIIFDQVETEEEADVIRNICSDALVSGNLYSKERRLRI